MPADETLDRLVFGQAECIVEPRRIGVPRLGALPELAHVGARKQGPVLLRFMLENGRPLAPLPGD